MAAGFSGALGIWNAVTALTDQSGQGNDLTNYGSVTTATSDGRLAWSFPGTAGNRLATTGAILTSGPLTWACWFRVSEFSSKHRLVGQYTNGAANRAVLSLIDPDLRAFSTNIGSANASPSAETWHLGGMTVTAGRVEVWMDGTLQDFAESGSSADVQDTDFAIGGDSEGGVYPYDSLLDGVHCYGRELTSTEWSDWYSGGRAYVFPEVATRQEEQSQQLYIPSGY